MKNKLGHKLIVGRPYYHLLHGKSDPLVLEFVDDKYAHIKKFGKHGAVSWVDNNYLAPYEREVIKRYLKEASHG